MAAITIRDLADETHRGIKQRAASNGRSAEAEVRSILDAAVRPADGTKIGSALAAFGRRHRGIELDITRDPTSAGTTSSFE